MIIINALLLRMSRHYYIYINASYSADNNHKTGDSGGIDNETRVKYCKFLAEKPVPVSISMITFTSWN